MTTPLWQPSAETRQNAHMTAFMQHINKQYGLNLADFDRLWRWSVESCENFWQELRLFVKLIDEGAPSPAIQRADRLEKYSFFPNLKINYAENLLARRDDGDAIIFRAEDKVKSRLSWAQLYEQTAKLSAYLKAAGLKPGDRVGGFIPNCPEAVIAMLATTALGGVWTSCSPDFGKMGVIDRFGQTAPRFLFSADGYYYNGKANQSIPRVADFIDDLPSVETVIIFPLLNDGQSLDEIAQKRPCLWWDDATAPYKGDQIDFVRVGFNDPLFIMYSSGTTGKPKCIIHRTGGVLITHRREHVLHCNLNPNERIFFFTTCGWMMWNWLVSSLASGLTLMLYDGSPFAPDGNVLFDYAAEENCTLFGVSAKYIDACNKAGLKPIDTHKLPHLKVICSTGSPLAPDGFDYVYNAIKKDVQLSSISGGTDLIGCLILGNPLKPVWRGEIQGPALGMDIDILDDNGNSLRMAQGDIVCKNTFPSQPIGFWGDNETMDKYHSAYFEKFPNIWTHGDFCEVTEHGGYIVYGRSDATLNPGGVRIGTAEIYNQVEAFPDIQEAVVIGQDWQNDTRVVLFVRMAAGKSLDDELCDAIKARIKQNCSPRHVPAKIIAVADIPRTRSGKITELAVRDVVHGRPIKNREALANAEALALFANLPELST